MIKQKLTVTITKMISITRITFGYTCHSRWFRLENTGPNTNYRHFRN